MAKVILKTSKGDGEKDDFWTKSAQFLLEAVLFLLVEESEKTAEWITNKDGEKVIKPGTRDISHLNMASVGEKLRRMWHVRCILDEFANISQIPAFEEVIAIIRSREISVNVIIQTVSQLKTKY